MPQDLVDAHRALDRAFVADLAPKRRLVSDGDLLTVLFDRYQELTAAEQLIPSGRATPPGRRR